MRKHAVDFYSEDVDDACDLTAASLDSLLDEVIEHRIIFHSDDIYRYNPEHPALPLLEQLNKDTKALIKLITKTKKELGRRE
jgi:hypothetical protein